MVVKTTTVQSETGLHARPAAALVNFVKSYPGEVKILYQGKSGNLKSILNIMALGIVKGSEIAIEVNGEKEEEFADAIISFIEELEG